MQGLASVQLTGIEVKGTAATAGIRHGGVLATNAVMPFVKTAGAWKLDLKKILLAPEPQFDALRAQRRLGKPELAVLLIENVHGQPISVLRELLLSPQVRRMVAALRGASPSNVCARVFTELSEGRQQDAEALLDVFAEVHTNDQRLAFIQATCSRSRFSINRADMQFEQVMAMNPTTVEGNAARYMLELDARRNVQDNMNGMRLLIGQNPDSPLLLWLMGIACQDNYKRTGETKLAKEGADSYRLLMKRFTVGPVLVHQTFANILAEQLALYEEALPHRELAVRLEPAAWTYQGLANTLTSLKRYDEADAAFRKVIEFDPDSAMFWAQWADSQSKADKYDSCIEKSRKAIELDPSYHRAYASLGFALQAQGKLEEALTAYKRAIAVNPAYGHAYAQAAAILTKLGRHEEAQDFLKRKKSIPGW
jgi:tetratricopeptide (TPR) repeat protein